MIETIYITGDKSCVCCGTEGLYHAFGCPGENDFAELAYRDWLVGHADARRGLRPRSDGARYRLGHLRSMHALWERAEAAAV